jgi:hypothetical protein
MRMMLLAKLRAVGAAALATLALTTGLGFGLVPARGSDPKPGEAPGAATAGAPKPPPAGPVDDATFFRRVCLDLRGTHPSTLELGYFGADRDANKRRKVVDWLLTDEAVKAHLAKKLGVPAERVRIITLGESIAIALEQGALTDAARALALSPDGKIVVEANLSPINSDGGVSGSIVLNERTFDLVKPPARVNLNEVLVFKYPSGEVARIRSVKQLMRVTGMTPDVARAIVDWIDPSADPPADVTDEQLKILRLYALDPNQLAESLQLHLTAGATVGESDAEFLRKAVQSARGAAPSAVEERYFAEDQDPKKREKLLDLLLKDPAVAKKLGDDWKKRMLEPQVQALPARAELSAFRARYLSRLALETERARQSGRLEKLVGELVGAKKTDEQVLDGLTLALLGRLPTASEKLTLAAVGKAADRAAAWVEVARALAATEEAKKHAAELDTANPREKR